MAHVLQDGAGRVSSRSDHDLELLRLSWEAAEALDELRETLRELRSEVNDQRTFVGEAKELIVRLERRSGLSVSLVVVNPGQTLTLRLRPRCFASCRNR